MTAFTIAEAVASDGANLPIWAPSPTFYQAAVGEAQATPFALTITAPGSH